MVLQGELLFRGLTLNLKAESVSLLPHLGAASRQKREPELPPAGSKSLNTWQFALVCCMNNAAKLAGC